MLDVYLLRDYIYLRANGGFTDTQFQNWLANVASDSYSDNASKTAVLATINQAIADLATGKIAATGLEDRLRSGGVRVSPRK